MPEIQEATEQASLQGRKVCLAGRLVSMTHLEMGNTIAALGGVYLPRPRRANFLLVIGDDGWPARGDGSPTRTMQYAARLQALGYSIQTQMESEFLRRWGLTGGQEPYGRLTLAEVTRLLGVSSARVRGWIRAGLLEPSAMQHRLAFFDFHQVTNARRLCELLAAGTTLAAIRNGLEQLGRWLPAEHLPFAPLARLEHDGRLLLRLNGRLVDAQGQEHFDFADGAGNSSTIALPREDSKQGVDRLFDAALFAEDAGNWSEAARHYAAAIASAPEDPTLRFNYGNVLFELREYEACRESFRVALAIDPEYAEAWNNLGYVLMQLRAGREAEVAFRRALLLVPDYEEARAGLADLLGAGERAAAAAADGNQAGAMPAADWRTLRILRP